MLTKQARTKLSSEYVSTVLRRYLHVFELSVTDRHPARLDQGITRQSKLVLTEDEDDTWSFLVLNVATFLFRIKRRSPDCSKEAVFPLLRRRPDNCIMHIYEFLP